MTQHFPKNYHNPNVCNNCVFGYHQECEKKVCRCGCMIDSKVGNFYPIALERKG